MKIKSGIEKLIHIFLNILLVVFGILLLIAIYINIQTKVLGNEYANFFGYSIFEVQTNSMEDAIIAGDLILVQLTKSAELNDIITFKQDGVFVTHRVIEAYKGTYITKGDANSAKDKPIDEEEIVGKVVNILPNLGLLQKTIFNPFVIIALLITITIVNSLFKKPNKKNKTKEDEGNNKDMLENIKGLISDKFLSKFQKEKTDEIDDAKLADSFFRDKNDFFGKTSNEFTSTIEETKNEYQRPKEENTEVMTQNVQSQISSKVSGEDFDTKTLVFDMKEINGKPSVDDTSTVKTQEVVDEELGKTSMYRVISVNVGNSPVEEEVEEEPIIAPIKEEPIKEEIPVEEDNLTDITLEMLNKKIKKSKNILEKIVYIKQEELSEIIEVIYTDKYLVNELSIKNLFLQAYTDARFYNYYSDKSSELFGKTVHSKLDKVIKEYGVKIASTYKGSDKKYTEKVAKFTCIFLLLTMFEKGRETLEDSTDRNAYFKDKLVKFYKDQVITHKDIKNLVTEINKIQRKYISVVSHLLKASTSDKFEVEYIKASNNLFATKLNHNLEFNMLYSDYIIDKTYNEGLINEEKTEVLLNLLLVKLTKEVYKKNFKNNYLLYIPSSLCGKAKKLERLISTYDNEFAKENIVLLVKAEDLFKNKQLFKTIRKDGYRLSVMITDKIKITTSDKKILYILDYIFADKKSAVYKSIYSDIPSDLQKEVINIDLITKIENVKGE